MRDEEYVYFQDLKEKKVTGYSARKQRSHCGKAGCKLPSDYLTKKEIKNMSGELKSYRLNEPMKFAEFKAMPNDLQMTYITAIREKYNAPVSMIGKMMGIERANLSKYLREVLGFGKFPHGNHTWDKEGFMAWAYGIPKQEQTLEEILEETHGEDVEVYETAEVPDEVIEEETLVDEKVEKIEPLVIPVVHLKVIPTSGNMTFSCCAADALKTATALLRDANVRISISWEALED